MKKVFRKFFRGVRKRRYVIFETIVILLIAVMVVALFTESCPDCGQCRKKATWESQVKTFNGPIQSKDGWMVDTCRNNKAGAWECVMKRKVSSGCGCGG